MYGKSFAEMGLKLEGFSVSVGKTHFVVPPAPSAVHPGV
jgi:hypothetical protein